MKPITRSLICAKDITDAHKCLDEYHSDMLKHNSYLICKAKYVEDIADINSWLSQIMMAESCGTLKMKIDDCVNYTEVIKRNFQYAVVFLSDPPQNVRKAIVWDDMPDLLTDDQLSEYFGWAIPTIQSKRSRGELPKVEGYPLTPKKQLMEMFETLSMGYNDTTKADADAVRARANSFKKK